MNKADQHTAKARHEEMISKIRCNARKLKTSARKSDPNKIAVEQNTTNHDFKSLLLNPLAHVTKSVEILQHHGSGFRVLALDFGVLKLKKVEEQD